MRLEESVRCVQRFLSGYASRQQVNRVSLEDCVLPESEQTDYPAMFAGNDPEIVENLTGKKIQQPFLLVGTSCFFTLKVAAYLCEKNQYDLTQQIVVIDNSKAVIQFWKIMKVLFSSHDDFSGFKQGLEQHFSQWAPLSATREANSWECEVAFSDGYQPFVFSSQKLMLNRFYRLLETLCAEIGFSRLKKWVMSALVIPADFVRSPDKLFHRIQQLAEKNQWQIAAYTSNVLGCEDKTDIRDQKLVDRLLDHLSLLWPVISVYSDIKYFPAGMFRSGSNFVSAPSRLLCCEGVGDRQYLKNTVGYETAKVAFENSADQLHDMQKHFTSALMALRAGQYEQMLSSAKAAYDIFNPLCSEHNLLDQFLKQYVLSRILGVALLKNNKAEGAFYLKSSAVYLRGLYGDCAIVNDYEAEVRQWIQGSCAVERHCAMVVKCFSNAPRLDSMVFEAL